MDLFSITVYLNHYSKFVAVIYIYVEKYVGLVSVFSYINVHTHYLVSV